MTTNKTQPVVLEVDDETAIRQVVCRISEGRILSEREVLAILGGPHAAPAPTVDVRARVHAGVRALALRQRLSDRILSFDRVDNHTNTELERSPT